MKLIKQVLPIKREELLFWEGKNLCVGACTSSGAKSKAQTSNRLVHAHTTYRPGRLRCNVAPRSWEAGAPE